MSEVVERYGAGWGEWPVLPPHAHEYVSDALESRRWAISSAHSDNTHELYEEQLARQFSAYVDAPVCVPVDHGSSALIVALEALSLPPRSHVIVPALTWVATATAVFRAGHVPIVADVDPFTGNIVADTVRAALTRRTAAIIVVHWACTMADMDDLTAVAAELGIPIVEDCAQAHGARWNGASAGTLGDFGCFSFQQAKVLSAGEGGVVVSRDARRSVTLQELRADSRSWKPLKARVSGELALAETAGVMGSNFGLNEMAAALACAQLEVLDAQHAVRNENYAKLSEAGTRDGSFMVPAPLLQQTKLSIYEVPIRFNTMRRPTDNLIEKLRVQTGVKFYRPRHALVGSALLQPSSKSSAVELALDFDDVHRDRVFPNANEMAESAILIHHSALLASNDEMNRLLMALRECG